ncbi:MAG: AbrB family transcriptional regulator [Desulfurococcaceae archaeon]|nr:AbrB family transcriptional regulator [Desulfurococcaceae archaeon]
MALSILKVRKRGVVILSKELRSKAGIEEDSEVVAEIRGNEVLLRLLKSVIVSVDWAAVEKILHEEDEVEEEKLRKILKELRS